MTLTVTRLNLRLTPDHKKVIPRFFYTGDERSQRLIAKVLQMADLEAESLLSTILKEFSGRYRNIHAIFLKHFDSVKQLLPEEDQPGLSETKRLLIGSYFTMEYSLEAAAIFNPSIVEDPDQADTATGEKRVILSFRATGESHISSIVFKKAILDKDANVHMEQDGIFMTEGVVTQFKKNNKEEFENLLEQMVLPGAVKSSILNHLKDKFSYKEIERVLKQALLTIESHAERKKIRYDILSVINTNYELNFPPETLLSERVIFPVTRLEKNGIEDARFVKFTEEDGSIKYIATYTAYDGSFILPQLIETVDFCQFKISALQGKAAINKNLALFPRKVNGQYVMVSRIDGMNNYIMFSDDLHTWEKARLLQQPKYPWAFVQIGNAGSPIETEKGWLLITHGVGPMRKYCLGASLFDLNDPTIELGQLKEPLLAPDEEERYGYVPNVVYSCGSILHGDKLIIPYAVSDYASSFATVKLNDLLDAILQDS